MIPEKSPEPRTLMSLVKASVRVKGKEILKDLTWSLEEGRSWAVTGSNGAGKSTFLRLVRGDIWPAPGCGERWYYLNGAGRTSPLGFKEGTRLVSLEVLDQYRRLGWDLTCLETVCTGFHDSPLLYTRPGRGWLERAREALAQAEMDHLAEKPITELSQGQAKKVLLARAMIGDPKLMILDEPCEGLDQGSRERFLETLDRAARAGTQLLYATHRPEELDGVFSHHLHLEGGRIVRQGPWDRKKAARKPSSEGWTDSGPRRIGSAGAGPKPAPELIRLRGTAVSVGGRRLLEDLRWTVRAGEHWAVLGGNGAGKSTLMKLILGDLRPALGGEVVRFSDPKLANIWEIRKRIGLVSALSQAEHKFRQSVEETVLSGFTGSIGFHRPAKPEELSAARRWMEFFGLSELAGRDVTGLSYGQLRKTLLARAMVMGPEILLLDEPLAGLDPGSREEVAQEIERLARAGTTIIYATHYPEELVPSITHVLVMEGGRIAFQGRRGERG